MKYAIYQIALRISCRNRGRIITKAAHYANMHSLTLNDRFPVVRLLNVEIKLSGSKGLIGSAALNWQLERECMIKQHAKRGVGRGPLALVAEPEVETDADTHLDALTEDSLSPLYRVIIHNDEVTPFDFVILILRRFFHLSPPDSEYVTYLAHTQGLAHVATLPLPEAQKRVGQAHFAAGLEGYPLQFTIEPE